MNFKVFIALCSVYFIARFESTYSSMVEPEQVHLSYGVEATEMIVTWTTLEPTNHSIIQYGTENLNSEVEGYMTKFVDGGLKKRAIFIHRVFITNLMPDTVYFYRCGSAGSWSEAFRFHTRPIGLDWIPRLAFFGDMGVSNAQSVPRLLADVTNGLYDAVFHVGDFAYDMYQNDGMKGDEFMRLIQPIAANVPYMTCVGNHENAYNFSHYVNRFTMMNLDGEINNHFYSFNMGRAHIISFSTEFYFFLDYGHQQIANQLRWLENDLRVANEPRNRVERPWIITLAHRPMYCSTLDDDDCARQQSFVRHSLEELLYKYGVDLEIWAHEHMYERMFPVYDEKVYNGSYSHPYTNPRAPVHIITGSAGCCQGTDTFIKNPHKWSAFRSSDYGYTRMNVINRTHLYIEQVSDNKDGAIIDKVMIIKELHGPEAWLFPEGV